MKRLKFFSTLLFAVTLSVLVYPVAGLAGSSIIGATILFIPSPKNVLALNATNNIAARQAFDVARRMFANAMLDKFIEKFGAGAAMQKALGWANSLKLTQGEIRREVQLTTTAQTFTFGVTVQQASQGATGLFNTEVPLQLQDSLCIQEYGIFLRNPASATSTIDKLRTYADVMVFSTANVATAANGTFWANGQFKMTVNNDILIPSRGLYNHFYVPQTQETPAVAAATGPTTTLYQDQVRGAEDGFVTMEPNVVLIGSKNYQPQIVLPVALAAVETNQRAVLIMRGILAQNSTVIN